MSFLPKFDITRIPRSNTTWFLVDTTGTYPTDPTGYGGSHAPVNLAAITSLFGAIQAYGEDPVNSSDVSGDLATEAEIDVAIIDGVNTFIAYYGQLASAVWTISADRTVLTVVAGGLNNLLDSVYGISDGSVTPVAILSKSDTVITLAGPYPGALTTDTGFYRYFKGTKVELSMNQGFGQIVNRTAKLAYRANKPEKLIDLLDDNNLFVSAQYEFANGNYALAHEKARLLIYSKPKITNTCATC